MAITPVYQRPDPSEYAPYQKAYVDLVPEPDVMECLRLQLQEAVALINALSESRGDYAYAPGKWTLKEVIGHVSDAERVLSYRALRVARGDTIRLPAFEQDAWVVHSRCSQRTLADLIEELGAVRQSTLCLFGSLHSDALLLRGATDAGNAFTVRAMPYVIAGHARHHMRIIRERYL